MKKALHLFLALVLCLSLVPLTAAAAGPEISLAKTQFGRCEPFDVSYTGITAKMEEDGVFVAIYRPGAEDWDSYSDVFVYKSAEYPPAGSGKITFIAPDEPGQYEVRLYEGVDGGYHLIKTITFTVSGTSNAYGDKWLQLPRSNYNPNEYIEAMVFNLTPQEAEDAWVGLYKKGAIHDDFLDYRGVTGGDSEWGLYAGCKAVFTAPSENGEYELRLFRVGKGMYGSANLSGALVTTVPFTVGVVEKSGSISLNKTTYTANEKLIITVSDITDQMVASRAFIALCAKGTSHENAVPGFYVRQGTSTVDILTAPNKNGEFEIRLYSKESNNNAATFVTSAPFTVTGALGSGWAQEQKIFEKAEEFGLIPDRLRGSDWTKPITRAEFAALAVKLYENLTGKNATPASPNPFTDTSDTEVLKAFELGITNGISATQFSPDALITREQMAVMLTRALKKAYIPNWTLATDSIYTLKFTMPQKFADDAQIGEYAKQSVYYMVANGILGGVGNNKFAPKNTSSAEEAINYANATREQSLAVSVRIVENLKDKPIDYSGGGSSGNPNTGGGQTPPVTPPTTPPSSSSPGWGDLGFSLPEKVQIDWTTDDNTSWMDMSFSFTKFGNYYFAHRVALVVLLAEYYLEYTGGTTWTEYARQGVKTDDGPMWGPWQEAAKLTDLYDLRDILARDFLYFVGSVEDIPEVKEKGKFIGQETVVGRTTDVYEITYMGTTQNWYIDPVYNITLRVSGKNADNAVVATMKTWNESITGLGADSLP